jgi:hypothetical protein
MVHIALRAIVLLCCGAFEFVCDAREFQSLSFGDGKTILHFVPIIRIREFAMDAKGLGLLYARLAICVRRGSCRSFLGSVLRPFVSNSKLR